MFVIFTACDCLYAADRQARRTKRCCVARATRPYVKPPGTVARSQARKSFAGTDWMLPSCGADRWGTHSCGGVAAALRRMSACCTPSTTWLLQAAAQALERLLSSQGVTTSRARVGTPALREVRRASSAARGIHCRPQAPAGRQRLAAAIPALSCRATPDLRLQAAMRVCSYALPAPVPIGRVSPGQAASIAAEGVGCAAACLWPWLPVPGWERALPEAPDRQSQALGAVYHRQRPHNAVSNPPTPLPLMVAGFFGPDVCG